MIKAMVYYLMNPLTPTDVTPTDARATFGGSGNGCVVILDLHWNYSAGTSESGSYSPGITPPEQCAMAVATNSIAFWSSICTSFGLNSDGDEIGSTTCIINTSNSTTPGNTTTGTTYTLSKAMKQNVFFELYNEPYLDQIDTSDSSGYSSYSDYNNFFNLYIQGSLYYTGNPIKDPNNKYNGNDYEYNIVGMGTLYNNIRITNKCANIILLGAAESYASFAGYNYINYSTSPVSFLSTYNCWTKLNDAIISGKIPVLDNNGNTIQVVNSSGDNEVQTFANSSNGLTGVIANMHPYSNSYCKFPGYMYNTTNSDTSSSPNNGGEEPSLCNFLEALVYGTNPSYTSSGETTYTYTTSQDYTSFQISFPIICTEFGMYNLPWISSVSSDSTSYTTSYMNNPVVNQPPSSNWTGIETTVPGNYNYYGEYYSAGGTATSAPFIVGYFENFQTFNISYTIWVLEPNLSDFNQNTILQVNYSYADGPTTALPLLSNSNLNNNNITTPGQNGFDMTFCYNKYYLNNSEPWVQT